MEKISVHLLGRPYVEVNGERVSFPYKKAEGFFYYLCVKKNATREEIIYVLWGSDNENVGRKNLREAVYQIKKLLGKEILLTAGHTSISLNPECMPEIDWDSVDENNILEQEEEGILTHFHIKNCYEFEEWMATLQEQYNRFIIQSARQRLYEANDRKDMALIQKYGNILIKQDPYNEGMYQELMEIYAAGGSYNMAIKLYYDLEKILAEELEVEPSPEITELFHRIFNVKGNVAPSGEKWKISFVGRSDEIYEISQCLTESEKGRKSQCVAITGEEGTGKTALLDKAEQLAKGFRMISLRASCYRDEKDFFLRPWNDIFWEIEQCIENKVFDQELIAGEKEQLKQLFTGLAPEGTEKMGRPTFQIIERVVLEMCRKITQTHRIVLVFDDIQWMDDMSFQLLCRILLTVGTEKVLLLCTYNLDHDAQVMESLEKIMRQGYLRVIRINPFTRQETEELLHRYLPQLEMEEEKKADIYKVTEGNAFFLIELINLIREKGYTLEMSPKANNVIKARLAGLPDIENQVLDGMSMFPEKVSAEELELILPEMDRLELLRILEKLQERHLIKEVLVGWNIYYEFVHRVFREYIYERQSLGKRRACHEVLAGYYENQAETKRNFACLPMIIHHYERCHDQVKTYEYKIKYLKEYYTIINENFPVLHWEIDYGDKDFGGTMETGQMMELAQEVIRLSDDSHKAQEMKMEMHYIIGRYGIAVGDYSSGIASIQKSWELAERLGQRKMLLNCCEQMCFYGIQVEDREWVKRHVDKALDLVEEEDQEEKGIFTRLLGWYFFHKGQYAKAEETLCRAIEIFRNAGGGKVYFRMSVAACYGYLGDLYREKEEWEQAEDYYKTAIQMVAGMVATNGLGQFYSGLGQLYFLEGKDKEAREYLERAVECLKGNGYDWGLERTYAYLALVLERQGSREAAKAAYLESRKISDKIKNPTTEKLLKEIEEQTELSR